MISLTLSRVRTYVTERLSLANSAFNIMLLKITMWKVQKTKKGLESPPGIMGTSIAECEIDQSAMSADAANNKIPGITKYNNFSLTSKSMCAWQAQLQCWRGHGYRGVLE